MSTKSLLEVRICPTCKSWMAFCFAVPGCEYVCPNCGRGETFYNACDIQEVTEEEYKTYAATNREKLIAIGKKTGAYK